MLLPLQEQAVDATGNGIQRLCLSLSAVLFVETQHAAFEMSRSTQMFRFGISQ